MRAVNLIPRDARRGGVAPSLGRLGAPHLVVGLLVAALAMVTLYVLSNNTVSQRKAQLAGLHEQISRVQGQVTRLQSYEKFEKLALAREATVQEIANGRFDWHRALSDLSKVIPANTVLDSVAASVSPASGGGSGGGGSVRGDLTAPAFSLKGCTVSQDGVAALMSRLRLINDVQRVTLEDSTRGTGGSSVGGSAAGCSGANFDMVVFFQPLTGTAATLNGVSTSTPAPAPAPSTPGIAK